MNESDIEALLRNVAQKLAALGLHLPDLPACDTKVELHKAFHRLLDALHQLQDALGRGQ